MDKICLNQNRDDLYYDKLNVTQMFEFVFEKRRKCWLPTFSPFTKMFSTALFLNVVKSRDSMVKGLFIDIKR